MSSIKPLDLRFVTALFDPEGKAGYVLDFTNRTFVALFRQELNLNFNDPKVAAEGASRGTLSRQLRSGDMAAEKWRIADEAGNPFVCVSDIFPE